MKCKDENKCFSPTQICDDFSDCSENNDENICQNKENLILNQTKDFRLYFVCNNDKYIPIYKYCDGINDCPNNEDELLCGK